MNLFDKRNVEFANNKWKGINYEEKKKGKNRFADKDLSSWTGLGGPDMSEVRLSVQFHTFRVENLLFEVISRWFCVVLRREAQKTRFWNQKT